MRRAASAAAAVMIAAALLALAGSSAAALVAMDRANSRVTQARDVLMQLNTVREAIAEEAIAEAGFRRAPADASWQRLEASMAAVPPAVDAAREGIGRQDGLTLSRLAVLNARYVAQIQALRERPSTERVDDRVAGPALDAMVELLEAVVDRHRRFAREATARQEALIMRLRTQLPAVFAAAFGLLGWAHHLNARDRRRLRREAASNRSRALTDGLTGLANRDALMGALREELARPGVDVTLLFVDLDRFKAVNDTWGHRAGDMVLQQTAVRLVAAVREEDLAARLGGDEFVVLVRTARDADLVARRVRAAFGEPFDADGHPARIGASIGIVASAEVGRDPDALLRGADAAMYREKNCGEGRINRGPGLRQGA